MLANRVWHWLNIKSTLCQGLVFAVDESALSWSNKTETVCGHAKCLFGAAWLCKTEREVSQVKNYIKAYD